MRRLRLLVLLIVGGLYTLAFSQYLLSTPASAAPISCAGRAYMVRSEAVGANNYSQLYEFKQQGATSVNLSDVFNGPTGLTFGGTPINDSTAFPTGFVLNALAYNPVDGYMYIARNADHNTPTASNDLYRIHDDGSLETVATITFGNPTNLKGAAFSPDGTYYAIGVGSGGSDGDTKLTIVSGLNAAPTTPVSTSVVTMSMPVNMGDIVYDFTNDTLYAVSNVTNMLYSIDTTSGAVTTISTGAPNGAGVSIGTNGIGSLYMTSTGQLIGYINGNSTDTEGQLVRINKSNGVLTLLKVGPVTNNSDATSCVPVGYTIDTVKSVGAVTADDATTFHVPYTVQVTNLGVIDDPNVQLVDDLSLTFAEGAPTISVSSLTAQSGPCTVNTSYDGTSDIRLLTGTDTLAPDQSCRLTFTVNLQYADSVSVPANSQLNTVYASTTSTGPNDGHTFDSDGNPTDPFNVLAIDTSTDSPTLPNAGNGDTPTPTPVVLSVVVIDVVKSAGSVTTVDTTHYKVPYTLVVGNTGAVAAPNVQVVDNLKMTFAAGTPEITVSDQKVASGPCTINSSFNGVSDIRTLSGADTLQPNESCSVTFTVTLGYASASVVPTDAQNNIALASSVVSGPNPGHTYTNGTPVTPAGTLSQDSSTDTSQLPSAPHGDNPSPTPVVFQISQIAAQLAATGVDQVLMISGAVATVAVTAGFSLRRFI